MYELMSEKASKNEMGMRNKRIARSIHGTFPTKSHLYKYILAAM